MKDKEKRINIRITESQYLLLAEAAALKGLSITSYIRMTVLEKALESLGREVA